MTSWIRHSAARGILTSRYPDRAATDGELPEAGRTPTAHPEELARLSDGERSLCPTGAIREQAVDQGRCIRCERCFAFGLRPLGSPAMNAGTREELRESAGLADRRPTSVAPFGTSLHVFMIDVGSCHACNAEVLALGTPYYDLNRLGLFFTNSPRHADVLVVVGVPTPEMVEPLRRTYEAMPGPKAVLAVGACAIDRGIFADGPRTGSSVGEIVPVDLYVAGCPPPPVAILEGVLALAGRGATPEERR